MSAENIYDIMEVSKQASKLVKDSKTDAEGNNNNAYYGFWEDVGFGVIFYFNFENNRKEIQNNF